MNCYSLKAVKKKKKQGPCQGLSNMRQAILLLLPFSFLSSLRTLDNQILVVPANQFSPSAGTTLVKSKLFQSNLRTGGFLPLKFLPALWHLVKYNLATHYGVDPNKITPKFVKTFDREMPRSVWYNTVKALPSDMKLHDGIVDWCSKSVQDIMNSIDLKH